MINVDISAVFYNFFFILVSPLGSVFITPSVNNSFEEQSVTLTCNARGGPNNGFQWNYTRTRVIVGMDSDYTLNTSVETAGYYQCIVSNRAGSDDNTATVNGKRERERGGEERERGEGERGGGGREERERRERESIDIT